VVSYINKDICINKICLNERFHNLQLLLQIIVEKFQLHSYKKKDETPSLLKIG
jgi:hypothetical protein